MPLQYSHILIVMIFESGQSLSRVSPGKGFGYFKYLHGSVEGFSVYDQILYTSDSFCSLFFSVFHLPSSIKRVSLKGEVRISAVPFRDYFYRCRPDDAEGRVVPAEASGSLGGIKLGHLVKNLCVVFQG